MYFWRDDLPDPPDPADPVGSAGSGQGGRLIRAFTDRSGGVSQGGHSGLNLGGHTDAPDAVEANRDLLAKDLDLPRDRVLFMRQVHGREVLEVRGPHSGEPPPADAMVTTEADLALAVLVADCVPVLVHDRAAGVLGVAHAGREGMRAGVVTALVEAARELGARHPVAVVGPSICPRCYEVPEELAAAAAQVEPASRSVSWTGTPAIDVAAGVVAQLHRAAVPVTWVPGCTRERPELFSHRRSAPTGRFAGILARRTDHRAPTAASAATAAQP